MNITKRPRSKFKVGEWASYVIGSGRFWAQIVEDRGPLGVNGRRIYTIRAGEEPDGVRTFELPEDYLERVEPDQEQIVKHLKRGGLLAILRSNLGGGNGQPKVWIAFDPNGNLTHTTIKERGFLGGATVPFFALQEHRIFTPKKDEVVDFLLSFGLTRDQAMDVVRSVGTAP